MEPLKISVHNMVAAAKARITEITAKDALNLIEDKNVVIVDIRDIRERHKLGYIPGSYHAPAVCLSSGLILKALILKIFLDQTKSLSFIVRRAGVLRSALQP